MKSSKQAILKAAEEIFASFGYDGTSTRDIALRADINVAMLNYYFGSKEKLLLAVVEQKAEEVLLSYNRIFNDPMKPQERLRQILKYHIDFLLTNPSIVKIFTRELSLIKRAHLHDRIIKAILPIRQRQKDFIKENIKSGVFKSVDVSLVMGSLFDYPLQIVNQNLQLQSSTTEVLLEEGIYPEEFRNRVFNYLWQLACHLLIS